MKNIGVFLLVSQLSITATQAASSTTSSSTWSCYTDWLRCKQQPEASNAYCAAQISQCLGHNPFTDKGGIVSTTAAVTKPVSTSVSVPTSNKTVVSTTPASTNADCWTDWQQCKDAPNANNAYCASVVASCLGYYPFTGVPILWSTASPSTSFPSNSSKTINGPYSNTTTLTSQASATLSTDCWAKWQRCKSGSDPNKAYCAASLASCLGRNPFTTGALSISSGISVAISGLNSQAATITSSTPRPTNPSSPLAVYITVTIISTTATTMTVTSCVCPISCALSSSLTLTWPVSPPVFSVPPPVSGLSNDLPSVSTTATTSLPTIKLTVGSSVSASPSLVKSATTVIPSPGPPFTSVTIASASSPNGSHWSVKTPSATMPRYTVEPPLNTTKTASGTATGTMLLTTKTFPATNTTISYSSPVSYGIPTRSLVTTTRTTQASTFSTAAVYKNSTSASPIKASSSVISTSPIALLPSPDVATDTETVATVTEPCTTATG